MKKYLSISGIIFLLSFSNLLLGQQDNKAMALDKAQKAIELMDDGQIKESVKLLEEAQKLDPERFDYPYELAYAAYLQKDYKGAIKILEKIKNHKDVSELLFQLLGNSYDFIGKTDKAFSAYDEGLKLFPKSGKLYLEKGNIAWGKEEFVKALPYYEKGIEIDPMFPSNYYRASLIYCNSTEEVWGMIYGEIFINLERNSKRTSEISKLLFDTYKSQIKFSSDTSFSVSFCKNATIKISGEQDIKNIKLPFGVGVYEPTLMMALLNEKTIDLNSLDRIRTSFVQNYFNMGHDKNYPNVLFNYQNKLKEAGHLEAYNHWLLLKGDEDCFDSWQTANKEKWDGFVKWFNENKMKLDQTNQFYRNQY